MILSKREKYLALGTIAAAAIFAVDYFLLTPYLARLKDIADQRDLAIKQQDADNVLFARQRKLRRVWADLQQGGLDLGASHAESQTLHALLAWAQGSGISLTSLKSERATQEKLFEVIGFSAAGTGSSVAVSRLIWTLETAGIPLRINDLQISSQPEGTDNLTIRLSVSALCTVPPPEPPAKPPAASSGENP